jgi:hypothetical protein
VNKNCMKKKSYYWMSNKPSPLQSRDLNWSGKCLSSYNLCTAIHNCLLLIQSMYKKNCRNKYVNFFLKNKATLQIGSNVRVRKFLMPDCWLEVSLHSEGPATDQFDQGFPWFSSILEQMLRWYPNSTLHCMLHMQPSHW